ncbi:MAG: hypothetical protein QXR53_02300 [Candidatus Norongarragalinales archaeon]
MRVDCQVCGKPAAGLGFVEGARVPLCETCSAYSSGFEVFKNYSPPKHAKVFSQVLKPSLSKSGEKELAEDYGKRIMQAREKLSLSRKDLARKLFIQEKELEGFEHQKFKPGEATIKKLEFALGISLLEQ